MNRFSFKYILDSNTPKNGTCQLYFRITVDRKKTECALNEWVNPDKFEPGSGRILNPNRYETYINNKLNRISNEINVIRLELEQEGKPITAKMIKQIYLHGQQSQAIPLLEFFETQVQEMVKRKRHAENTLKHYTICGDKLKAYLQSINSEGMTVQKFTLKNLHGFYNMMLQTVGVNTAINNMRKLRAILNLGIKNEIINTNPFSQYKMVCEKTDRVALTAEELKAITNYPLDNESLKRVRSLFLFSVYTGLRYKDCANLTANKITVDANGRWWIETLQEKTNRPVLIPILEPARDIIEFYKPRRDKTDKVLPMISNQKTNAYLKVIADLVGITKKITHHVARHTYCTTVLLENGVDIKSISTLAGHASLASTMVYSHTTRKALSDVANKVEEALTKYNKEPQAIVKILN